MMNSSAHPLSATLDLVRQDALQSMVHDLRTPMTVIKANLQVLLSGMLGEAPGEHKALLQRSVSAIEEMVWLTDTLLQAGQLEAGEIHLSPVPTDLDKLLGETIDFYQVPFQQRQMRLYRDGNTQGVHLCIDPIWAKRVLHNLVWNAFKFTPDQGRVIVHVDHEGDGIAVTIEDTGRGIAADKLNQLFGKYIQANQASDRKIGTGLGLWICRRVMELHGGSIEVQSTEGQGSRFILHFPSSCIL